MQERRQYKRFAGDFVEISVKMALANYVKFVDISIGGISFEADRRLNINREYTFEIRYKGQVLTVKGMVVWSLISKSLGDDKGNVVPVYKAGMKFTDVSREQIEKFIHHILEPKKTRNDTYQHKEFIDLSEEFKEELDMFTNSI